MENKKSGVFSPCKNLDSTSMVKCLQALLAECPSIKFSSVTTDNKYRGFKVLFSEPEDSIVLEKNYVSLEGKMVWIYPLTTHLILLNLDHKKATPFFERELRDAVNKKFGKVIDIDETTNPNQSKNWRIEIDIPEFIDLEDSQRRIYSDMNLPIRGRNEEVTLKLWCRQCKMNGHFQHECLSRIEDETDREHNMITDGNHNNVGQIENNFNERACSSLARNSGSTPKKTFPNISLVATERYAEKIGREEVMSFSKEKEKRVENNTTSVDTSRNINNNLLTENDIKKEADEFAQNVDTKQDKNTGVQKNKIPENNNFTKRTENENCSDKSRDSLLYEDDEIKIIEYGENSASPSHVSNSSHATAEARNMDGGSSSPETKNINFTSSFSAVPGPSFELSTAAAKSPRGAEVTTALSERLQECINQVCTTSGVLDRKKLDAFLIHVKKKSNPIRVALNYTTNTKGLKEQLKAILHMYYNTPQTGTKEDMQFIKWLNGLVERYDGSIPKKRKRSNKADDDTPTKR